MRFTKCAKTNRLSFRSARSTGWRIRPTSRSTSSKCSPALTSGRTTLSASRTATGANNRGPRGRQPRASPERHQELKRLRRVFQEKFQIVRTYPVLAARSQNFPIDRHCVPPAFRAYPPHAHLDEHLGHIAVLKARLGEDPRDELEIPGNLIIGLERSESLK